MTTAPADPARRPGRPRTGARERILAAGRETLLEEGYAGLTYGKVAERAGENKSLIAYHFGSKQGLVAAVADQVGERITADVLAGMRHAETIRGLASGLADGLWRVMDADLRLARLYFDLSAVSVVDEEVRSALRRVRAGWRQVIAGYLRAAGVERELAGAATWLLATVEGLAIERLEGRDPERLEAARRLFIKSADRTIT